MANSGPNTQGSQFFITFEPTHWLNGQHTVFGRVIEGQEVAWRIEKGDVIESVTVVRKRDHEYRPTLLAEPGRLPEGPPAPPIPPIRQPGSEGNVREGGG